MNAAETLAAALLLALVIDHLWGEPPARLHPVVWMGRALQWCGERVAPLRPQTDDYKVFWAAALMWCALTAIVVIVAMTLQVWWLGQLPLWLAAPLLACALKPLLAWRMLRGEVQEVEQALAQSLEAGRERLSWLVSRDTSMLDAQTVRESAIESLAENLCDSVVAPIFWFALLGLPGAALYRFANTADAMWGYPGMRGGRYWQWAGKWAARADDVLSWLPARITALLLALAAQRWPRRLERQACKTPSPNSGWPMAAMALLLGVRLSKPGVYRLNKNGRRPTPMDTRRALELAGDAVLLAACVAPALMLGVAWLLA
jgi:adenosylcobinamide-phosphate synthase